MQLADTLDAQNSSQHPDHPRGHALSLSALPVQTLWSASLPATSEDEQPGVTVQAGVKGNRKRRVHAVKYHTDTKN